MTNEDIKALVEWYRGIPEDFKRYVAFRHERVEDPSIAELYQVLALVKRISKIWKDGNER